MVAVPDELKPYFSDYKINVFEIAWLTEEQISHFTSDFKVVANFFVKKRIDPDHVSDDLTEIKHVDEVLKLLTIISGDKRYYEVAKSEKGKVKNMCEVAERLVNKGIEKGIQKGIKQVDSLFIYLINDNRIDDLKRAASDRKFQNKLMKEYGIIAKDKGKEA